MRQYKLLLVDDSQNMLKALQRTFRTEGYKLLTANSAREAMALLRREGDIDMVISDENMPEISGTELLKMARQEYPNAIRMMLTGLTDFEVAKNAINKGEIYKFFNKPWDDFELTLSVKYALKQKQLEERNHKLESALRDKEELLRQLEHNHPGITSKKMTKDGSIVIEG